MAYSNSIYDYTTNRYIEVETTRNLRVADTKRILGSNLGSIDTMYYSATSSAAGTATASAGVLTLSTGSSANGMARLTTISKARSLSGKTNLFRANARFGDTGATGNTREFGIYSDANGQFVFRLSGPTFSIVTKKLGVETVVNNGSFNGNGNSSGVSWSLNTNFHAFEILYISSSIRFIIDNEPIHTVISVTTSIVSSLVGQLYAQTSNTGGATTNNILEMTSWSVSVLGGSINNPQFYNCNGVGETRTLKGGGGTLQSISIGRLGGLGATLTIYDSTTGSGTIICIFDLTSAGALGTNMFGIEGVNFYNGLTYVTSGSVSPASVTFFWE